MVMENEHIKRRRGRPAGRTKNPVKLSLTPESYTKAKRLAFDRDLSVSRLIQSLIDQLPDPEPRRATVHAA